MMASLHEDLTNEKLFVDNKQGEYRYYTTKYGKNAEGYLVHEKGNRDAKAQLEAGGIYREPDDDGGHLIPTANKGSSGLENIDAQNKNLNRSSYKIHENQINREIDAGNKVYEHVETFKSNGIDRPNAYMGYYIVENDNGERQWEAFSYTNVSSQEQEEWNQVIQSMDYDNQYDENITEHSSMVDDLNNEYDQSISESNDFSMDDGEGTDVSNDIE